MAAFDKHANPYDEEGLAKHIEQALRVERPRGPLFHLAYPLFKRMFRPQLFGLENLPSAPSLFVGNHSLFASDGYLLAPVMWMEHGRFLRGLGDKALWTPLTEGFLMSQGAAIGHPDVCAALMQKGCDLMVFPGGAHEATKTQEQRYQLQWRERYGFVRMAAAHGYPIVPMAIVGPDEFYNHVMEGRDLPESRLGQMLKRFGIIDDNTRRDVIPPLPAGALGTAMPKPQYCYIQFGEPVTVTGRGGKPPSQQTLKRVRGEVAAQIESMLITLQALRDEDRNAQSCLRNLLTL